MGRHTPEPWYSKGCHIMTKLDWKEVQVARADLWNVGETAQHANARRIVACVNAMAGIGDDNALFFNGNSVLSVISSMSLKQVELERQLEELLSALECADGYISEVSEKTGFGQVHTLKVVRAAIKKAKGGAA